MKRYSILNNLDKCFFCGRPAECIHEVYFGSANRQISIENGFCAGLCHKEHNMSNDDLVIIVSLHESYNHFCTNRSIFYRDVKYLDVHAKTRIGFVGISEVQKNDHLYFEYSISDDTFDKKMDQLQKIFLKISTYLLKNNDEY